MEKYMKKRMDSGEILSQKSIMITEDDTVGTLEAKLSIIGRNLLLDTLKELPNISKDGAESSNLFKIPGKQPKHYH